MATKIKIKNLPVGYQSIISNGRHSIVGDFYYFCIGKKISLTCATNIQTRGLPFFV